MSTQHPDNVNSPFFAGNAELCGEDEIQEAYYAFSHLGCDEQMWDCEGKEVDNYIVKKLLSKYPSFSQENRLGEDIFITLRVPNPTIEKAEAKILLETLESIPRSFDASKLVYGDDVSPIFEVILPMTASSKCLERIYQYYKDFVVGKQDARFNQDDLKISDWIGEFKPNRINVIPLFEDMEHMLQAHTITKEYIKGKKLDSQRVFLARSDPAMNYGMISAVILNKIALQNLGKISEETGTEIFPIIGVGSAPFRGNLTPKTLERVVNEYPSSHTLTIQSAFKYDHPLEDVREAIKKLKESDTRKPQELDEEKCLEIIDRYSQEYQKQILELAPIINRVAKYVPSRRKRKLHIGLFGYSRNVQGVSLPRAITFTSSLYSMGLPPEILGLNALTNQDMDFLKGAYLNLEADLKDSLKYFKADSPIVPKGLREKVDSLLDYRIDEEHGEISSHVNEVLASGRNENLGEMVQRAANIRKFLG